MKKERRTRSLRWQMMMIVSLCWLLPVLLVLLAMGLYISGNVGRQAEENLAGQLALNLRMSADRLDGAVEASRLASYDPALQTAWRAYEADGNYAALHRESKSFLDRQYRPNKGFLFSTLCFAENPGQMTLTSLNESVGATPSSVNRAWNQDFEEVMKLAQTLDTRIGFLQREGRCYLVRNLLDSSYRPIGTLTLALNLPYYFENLTSLPWVASLSVQIDELPVVLKEAAETPYPPGIAGRGPLQASHHGNGYTLSSEAAINYRVLLAQVSSYRLLLFGMALLLIPMLVLTFRFFRKKVSRPVEILMAGAREVEKGELGYQLDYRANSREFQYLTDSFNQMSGQLQNQFCRLYQEELALQNARMKALQSHINPHFLNNTLENINWEARMSGDLKVSRMTEALSTVLDAALDRDGLPEVTLAREMEYVNAYLYIVSVRFGKRLSVNIDLPGELMDCTLPRLILQPVIENAVEHGFGPGGVRNVVTLRGWREGNALFLETENGGGLSAEDEAHIARLLSPDYDAAAESSRNIGIANVNLRLRILYGEGCGLRIFRGEGDQVFARLKIAQHPAPQP